MRGVPTKRTSRPRHLRWLARRLSRPYRGLLVVGCVLRICEMAVDLVKPWPIAAVIDQVLGTGGSPNPLGTLLDLCGTGKSAMLTTAAGAEVLLALVSAAFDYAGDRVINEVGERMSSTVRRETFAHLQRLPMSYHDGQSVGESTGRVTVDCDRIKVSLVAMGSTLVPGALCALSYAAALLLLDWRLGLIGLACIPLIFLSGARYHRRAHLAARRKRESEGRLGALVTEALRGIRTVQVFGHQDLHDRYFDEENESALRAGLVAADVQARRVPLLETAVAVGTAVLLWAGGTGVLRGHWSTGQLMVALTYLACLVAPLRSLSRLSMTFAQGEASAERIAELLAAPQSSTGPTAAAVPSLPARAAGRITVSGLALAYPGRPALRWPDLSIDVGERIALTGPNGVGKSTALALIAGLYRPTRGSVRIDGTPTTELPEQWLHRQVAVVLQDTFLFSGTLADNIRYGRPDAGQDEVLAAAEAALVTELTARLPDGLDTRLGDGGTGLSGGQRQRVGIARALLADAPIVLLDEPTSGLDPEAERMVVAALERLVTGRTVVMTTHRPALLRLATRVIPLAPAEPVPHTPPPRGTAGLNVPAIGSAGR